MLTCTSIWLSAYLPIFLKTASINSNLFMYMDVINLYEALQEIKITHSDLLMTRPMNSDVISTSSSLIVFLIFHKWFVKRCQQSRNTSCRHFAFKKYAKHTYIIFPGWSCGFNDLLRNILYNCATILNYSHPMFRSAL